MNIEMSDDEARELKIALDIRLVEMRNELVHTTDHAYRDDLRASLIRLEGLATRLDGLIGTRRAA